MVVLGAVGDVDRGDVGRFEDVGVRCAAGGDPPRLIAVGAQRGLGGHDRRRRRLDLVADDLLLGDDVDVALAVAGAVVERVDHRRQHFLGPVGVHRADLGEHPRALGDDVGGFDPAVQVADVRGRLVVDATVRHRDRGVGGREDRRAALLGPQAGVRGFAVELGLDAIDRGRRGDELADRRRVVEHVPELRPQLRGVEALGPEQPDLLSHGEQELEA